MRRPSGVPYENNHSVARCASGAPSGPASPFSGARQGRMEEGGYVITLLSWASARPSTSFDSEDGVSHSQPSHRTSPQVCARRIVRNFRSGRGENPRDVRADRLDRSSPVGLHELEQHRRSVRCRRSSCSPSRFPQFVSYERGAIGAFFHRPQRTNSDNPRSTRLKGST